MLPLFLLKIALHRCFPARLSFIVPRSDSCPVCWVFLHFFLSFFLFLSRFISPPFNSIRLFFFLFFLSLPFFFSPRCVSLSYRWLQVNTYAHAISHSFNQTRFAIHEFSPPPNRSFFALLFRSRYPPGSMKPELSVSSFINNSDVAYSRRIFTSGEFQCWW